MAERRGPLFRLLGLHSFRCATCGRDVLWRRQPPVVCRWCGGMAIGFVPIIRKATERAAAFAAEFERLKFTTATSDQVDALRWALSLTRVDTPPEQV